MVHQMAKTKLKMMTVVIHNKKKEDERRWALQYKLARMQRKAYRAKIETNKKEKDSECKLREFFANCTDILPACDVSCAEPFDIFPVTMYEPDLFNLLQSFVDHQ
jgi:hypothetical protein